MRVIAKANYLRIAPRKVRLAADLIRRKEVDQAQKILKFTVKKASEPLLKLLNSAVANAKNNFQLESNNLYIEKITVDEGPKYKRWMPRARGNIAEIQKKTSHVTIVLEEIKKTAKKTKRKKKETGYRTADETKKDDELEAEKKEFILKKPKPKPEVEIPKPKIERGIKRIFRRKSF